MKTIIMEETLNILPEKDKKETLEKGLVKELQNNIKKES